MRNTVLVVFYVIMLIPVIPALPFIMLLAWAEGESPSKRRIRAQQREPRDERGNVYFQRSCREVRHYA